MGWGEGLLPLKWVHSSAGVGRGGGGAIARPMPEEFSPRVFGEFFTWGGRLSTIIGEERCR